MGSTRYERLKRYYEKGWWTKEDIELAYKIGWLTRDEYHDILGMRGIVPPESELGQAILEAIGEGGQASGDGA